MFVICFQAWQEVEVKYEACILYGRLILSALQFLKRINDVIQTHTLFNLESVWNLWQLCFIYARTVAIATSNTRPIAVILLWLCTCNPYNYNLYSYEFCMGNMSSLITLLELGFP